MKHLQLHDFHPENKRAYVDKPDANFSAQRNYAIIEETNRENDIREASLDAKVIRNIENTTDMLTSYGIYRLGGSGTKKIEDYLGREIMKQVYGEQLMSKIKIADSIRKLNLQKGNTLYGGMTYMPER